MKERNNYMHPKIPTANMKSKNFFSKTAMSKMNNDNRMMNNRYVINGSFNQNN